MKQLIRFLLASIFLITFSTPAFSVALSTYWNVGTYGTGDGLTADFDRLTYEADTTSVQYDTDLSGSLSLNDIFVDTGDAYTTSLQGSGTPVIDHEGLLSSPGYVFTFAWDNLTGSVYDINPGLTTDAVVTKYTSGAIDFWLDDISNGIPSLGPTYSTSDDSNIDRGDSLKVATVEILYGTGNLTFDKSGNMLTGSYNLTGQFTSLDPGFWFEASTGDDLLGKYVDLGWLLGFTSGDTTDKRFVQTFSGEADTLWTIDSRHSSNFELAVIPEPSTLLLLGAGLAGLGFYSRRRK